MQPQYFQQATTGMYALKQLRVKALRVQTTGIYQPQYVKPYQSTLTASAKKTIMNAVDRPGSSIVAGIMAKISYDDQIVKPNANFESAIMIPDGWNSKRLRFVLEVESTDATGINTYVQHISGWTDHHGVSHGNSLDNTMQFVINNISISRVSAFNSPMGMVQSHQLVDNSQLISNTGYMGIGQPAGQRFGLRPDDIYSQIDSRDFASAVSEDTIAIDTRGILTSQPVKSNRLNAIPAAYTANLLDAWLQTSRTEEAATTERHIAASTVQVESQSISEDPFMSFLQSRSALGVAKSSFTLDDLRAADPSCEPILRQAYLAMSPQLASTLATTQNAAEWHDTGYVTQFATSLAQALPSYLTQAGLNKIRFSATNETLTGEVMVTYTELARSFTLPDVRTAMTTVANKLKAELLNTLGYGGSMKFIIEGSCDLLGDTILNVNVNNSGNYRYVYPTMADGLGAPIQTQHAAVVNSMATSFSSLMDMITDKRDRNTPNNPTGSFLTSGLV